MKFFFSIVVFLFACNAYAQIHKTFIDGGGWPIKDSTKADGYILYQVLLTETDSIWSVVKFDMHNVPVLKGSYLDAQFSKPYGKFTYYQKVVRQKKIDADHSSIDTLIEMQRTGVYNNLQRQGAWMDYYADGTKHILTTFENGELNGLYEEYNSDGSLLKRGNYIKNLKEGDWYVFRSDSTLETYYKFKHGYPISTTEYHENEIVYSAYADFDFNRHITRYLKKAGLPPMKGDVVVTFTVDENGKVSKAETAMGIDPILDKAIIEAVNQSPKWVPAKRNGKRVEQKVSYAISYNSVN